MTSAKYIVMACLLLFSYAPISALAETQKYTHNPEKRIEVIISDQGLNRIEVEKDRILKFVGNDGDYAIDADLTKGFIYLNARVAKNKTFPAIIISEKGMIQDIKFKVAGDIDSRTIIIKSKKDTRTKTISYISFEDRVTSALSNVLNYQTDLYQTRALKTTSYASLPLKLEKATEYLIPNESFKIIKIEYISKKSLNRVQLTDAFPDLIAALERSNNIIIAVKV